MEVVIRISGELKFNGIWTMMCVTLLGYSFNRAGMQMKNPLTPGSDQQITSHYNNHEQL